MANFNNNNRPNKKRAPKINNPDPMSNVRDMGRYGIRVIREIAKGKFNFYNEGHIFRNPDFTNATLKEVEKKIKEAQIHVTAMQFAYQNSQDYMINKVLMDDMKMLEGYQLVYSVLRMIADNAYDTRYLQILLTQLPKYKYNM